MRGCCCEGLAESMGGQEGGKWGVKGGRKRASERTSAQSSAARAVSAVRAPHRLPSTRCPLVLSPRRCDARHSAPLAASARAAAAAALALRTSSFSLTLAGSMAAAALAGACSARAACSAQRRRRGRLPWALPRGVAAPAGTPAAPPPLDRRNERQVKCVGASRDHPTSMPALLADARERAHPGCPVDATAQQYRTAAHERIGGRGSARRSEAGQGRNWPRSWPGGQCWGSRRGR